MPAMAALTSGKGSPAVSQSSKKAILEGAERSSELRKVLLEGAPERS